MRFTFVLAMLVGCGGGPDPILRNAPHPDTATIAGAAAAVAGAATLASPDGAAKKAEANKGEEEKKPVKVKENVPAGVFDRLDEKPSQEEPKAFVDQAPAPGAPPSEKKALKKPKPKQ